MQDAKPKNLVHIHLLGAPQNIFSISPKPHCSCAWFNTQVAAAEAAVREGEREGERDCQVSPFNRIIRRKTLNPKP